MRGVELERPWDSLDTVTGVLFLLAMIAWYSGGGRALHQTIVATTIHWGALAVAVVAVITGLALGVPRLVRLVITALCAAFSTWSVLPFVNEWGSTAQTSVTAKVLRFESPSKSPHRVVIDLPVHGPTSFPLAISVGCVEGDDAAVTLNTGSLGVEWAAEISCVSSR
jgi:hypothetical protein